MRATDIVIREAVKGQLLDVLRLYRQPDVDEQLLSLPEAEQLFEHMAHYPDYKLYVAVVGAKVVGTFALLVMDNLGHLGAPSAVVEDVAVDSQWQRKGIGRKMMERALAIAASRGCYKVMLSADKKRTKAHAFYESLGFERHGYSFVCAQQVVPADGLAKRGRG